MTSEDIKHQLIILQSRGSGERADTDFVRTEIWPDQISLDDHRLTNISGSSNPFTEKKLRRGLAGRCRYY